MQTRETNQDKSTCNSSNLQKIYQKIRSQNSGVRNQMPKQNSLSHRRGAKSAKQTYIGYNEFIKRIFKKTVEVFSGKKEYQLFFYLLKPLRTLRLCGALKFPLQLVTCNLQFITPLLHFFF